MDFSASSDPGVWGFFFVCIIVVFPPVFPPFVHPERVVRVCFASQWGLEEEEEKKERGSKGGGFILLSQQKQPHRIGGVSDKSKCHLLKG